MYMHPQNVKSINLKTMYPQKVAKHISQLSDIWGHLSSKAITRPS